MSSKIHDGTPPPSTTTTTCASAQLAVALRGAPTRGGRIDLEIRSAASGFAVNISLPSDFTWPTGGLVLRLRSPSFPGKKLAQATVGGKAVAAAAINATDETVRFQAPEAGGLQSVAVTLA